MNKLYATVCDEIVSVIYISETFQSTVIWRTARDRAAVFTLNFALHCRAVELGLLELAHAKRLMIFIWFIRDFE